MNGLAVGVEDLTIRDRTGRPVVDQVSFEVPAGATLGIVGESGSGKTTVALALLGVIRPGLKITAGQVSVGDLSLFAADPASVRHLRRYVVSYLGQDPATSLEPTMRIGRIVAELLSRERSAGSASEAEVAHRLEAVGLPSDPSFVRRFPHQISGGQQQRVALARSLASGPAVLLLDEPTTGLDVVIQELILSELAAQRERLGFTTLVISHDLGVVAHLADRALVMRAGTVVESGNVVDLFSRPQHGYTAELIAACPDPRRRPARPPVASGAADSAPRLEVVDLFASHDSGARHRRRARGPRRVTQGCPAGAVVAAAGVSFQVVAGECVALVGSSGSGKTTIARAVAGLHVRDSGQVLLDGQALNADVARRSVEQRGRIQLIPQDPYGSLNPRRTAGAALTSPLRTLRHLGLSEAAAEVANLLEQVQLRPELADRYPRDLSGGERQRVAIARALAAGPELLICDEITSALDTSVQASILELLDDLRAQLRLALLVITHDFGVVARIADRVVVVDHGRLCEEGAVTQVLSSPEHEATRSLLVACRSLAEEIEQRRARAPAGHRESNGAIPPA